MNSFHRRIGVTLDRGLDVSRAKLINYSLVAVRTEIRIYIVPGTRFPYPPSQATYSLVLYATSAIIPTKTKERINRSSVYPHPVDSIELRFKTQTRRIFFCCSLRSNGLSMFELFNPEIRDELERSLGSPVVFILTDYPKASLGWFRSNVTENYSPEEALTGINSFPRAGMVEWQG